MPSFNPPQINDSRWTTSRAHLSGTQSWPDEITINYIDCGPPSTPASSSPSTTTASQTLSENANANANVKAKAKGTILLIHGFPETSYQFRHVITPLSDAGYRVIAPDYRGAGHSSHPRDGYTKSVLAGDLHELVTRHLAIRERVHVVGHDIGGMVAHAYASRFPEGTASVTWGECPLPGTTAYDEFKHTPGVWHFTFHWQLDLPEQLTAGRERIYLKHFYDRLSVRPDAINVQDLDHYTTVFSQPGAMRAGFDLYRAFHQDAEENRKLLTEQGRCKVPAQALNGQGSFLASIAQGMVSEMYEDWTVANVEGSGHWCAEENPDDFVKKVLDFVGRVNRE